MSATRWYATVLAATLTLSWTRDLPAATRSPFHPAPQHAAQVPKQAPVQQQAAQVPAQVQVQQQRVPSLYHFPVDSARRMLVSLKLQLGVIGSVKSPGPGGLVERQVPAAGEPVPRDRIIRVALTVHEDQGIVVPNVAGSSVAGATKVLRGLRLNVSAVEEASTSAAGTVIRQAPAAGENVKAGTHVTLTVAAAIPQTDVRPNGVRVPNVVGLQGTVGARRIVEAGLQAATRVIDSPGAAPNTIVSQAPAAGVNVTLRSVITLFVAAPPQLVMIPDVVGQSSAQATNTLRRARLVVRVQQVESTQPVETVIAQVPAAGTSTRPGDTIILTVAAPPKSTGTVPALLVSAREKLNDGNFEDSRRLYAQTLQAATTRPDSAAAYFGGTFASQQLLTSDSVPAQTIQNLERIYREAARLDSAKYFVAARYNVGLLYGSAGQHDAAAAEYLRGAAAGDSLRSTLLVNAGREFLRADRPKDAVAALVGAASDSALAPDAQRLLASAYTASGDGASLLQLADTLSGASAPLTAVNDALVGFMASSQWNLAQLQQCLVLFARNAALLNSGPASPGSVERAQLDELAHAVKGTPLDTAAAALVDVYRLRKPNSVFRPLAGSLWWSGDRARHKAWSSTLRAVGDWYFRAGQTAVARSYYEASLGLESSGFNLGADWVDLDALPPLAAIYGSLPDTTTASKGLSSAEQFTSALFRVKGSALRANDTRKIRLFRLTLGAMFARQQRWDGGAMGAIYQLEEGRRLTEQLLREDPAHPLHDPPDAFELLAREYRRRGCASGAARAGKIALEEYTHHGSDEDAARVEAFLRELQQSGGTGSCPSA